jgi:hypothetical protein
MFNFIYLFLIWKLIFISYYCFNFLLKMSVYKHQLVRDYHHYHHHRISQYANVYCKIKRNESFQDKKF